MLQALQSALASLNDLGTYFIGIAVGCLDVAIVCAAAIHLVRTRANLETSEMTDADYEVHRIAVIGAASIGLILTSSLFIHQLFGSLWAGLTLFSGFLSAHSGWAFVLATSLYVLSCDYSANRGGTATYIISCLCYTGAVQTIFHSKLITAAMLLVAAVFAFIGDGDIDWQIFARKRKPVPVLTHTPPRTSAYDDPNSVSSAAASEDPVVDSSVQSATDQPASSDPTTVGDIHFVQRTCGPEFDQTIPRPYEPTLQA